MIWGRRKKGKAGSKEMDVGFWRKEKSGVTLAIYINTERMIDIIENVLYNLFVIRTI